MDRYTAFFVIQTVFSIPEATRNDYFLLVYDWYMASWYTYNDLFFVAVAYSLKSLTFSIIIEHETHLD